jgi:signal transduction histidine kinase/ActR/RegA family two-component response regulator
MLSAAIELVAADKGTVQIRDADRGTLEIVAQSGFERDRLDLLREISAEDDSACGRALRRHERIVVEDVESDEPFASLRPMAHAAGYRAVQSTPCLARDGAPLGVLSTYWSAPHRPGEHDLRRLDLYARQAAGFIERCRMTEVLRASERRKDEFLATLSHELRNPLAPLRNALYLLRRTGDADGVAARIHEMMERQVGHLVRLVDDLLEMSRISRGALELRRERVDVATIVRNAVETAQPRIEAARHRLRVSLPEQRLWVDGDPVRLAQILANLLDNAAKYTDAGGEIAIEARRREGDVVLVVRDSGVGIPPEDLPRVFEMFSRSASSGERAGLGIGLALSRRLAEMHGGTLEARSAGPGRGAEFSVRLPLCPEPAPSSSREASREVRIPRKRILIVDDNRDVADSLCMLLALLGAEVRVARDGAQALEILRSYDPAVVLLDIGMPGMDGYEVARRIRSRFAERRPVLVAMTGWGQEEDRRRARAAGFDHHLIKPAEIESLRALLGSVED